jgi:hypothetical protein
MKILNKIFRKRHPKLIYLDEYKENKRQEALEDLQYMSFEEWERKYNRHMKKGQYRF